MQFYKDKKEAAKSKWWTLPIFTPVFFFLFFFAKATKHEIPQPPLVSLRLQIEGNGGEGGGSREAEFRLEFIQLTVFSPLTPLPLLRHTRDRAQRRQRTKTATVAQYILHIVNTHTEKLP